MNSEDPFDRPAAQERRGIRGAQACLLAAFLQLPAGISALAGEPTALIVDNFNANTPNTTDLNVDLARQF